jgi:hypothetical protein
MMKFDDVVYKLESFDERLEYLIGLVDGYTSLKACVLTKDSEGYVDDMVTSGRELKEALGSLLRDACKWRGITN